MNTESKVGCQKNNRLQHLRGFYYTFSLGSVSKAANKMLLNQSTVSTQIQSLESELGTKLFDRGGVTLKPNKDGKLLFELASDHIEELENIYSKFMRYRSIYNKKRIVVGVDNLTNKFLLPKVLKNYFANNNDFEVVVYEMSLKNALKALSTEEINVYIGPVVNKSKDYLYLNLYEFEPMFVTSNEGPLSELEKITIDEICKYPMIKPDEKLLYLNNLDGFISDNSIKLSLNIVNSDIDAIKKYVSHGVANSILYSICVEKSDSKIKEISIKDYIPKINYGIVLKKRADMLPQIEEFIKKMKPDFSYGEMQY